MSLNKAIKHKKEHRKEYHGSKAFDKTCRNHGGCDWCLENRMYQKLKEEERCNFSEEDFKEVSLNEMVKEVSDSLAKDIIPIEEAVPPKVIEDTIKKIKATIINSPVFEWEWIKEENCWRCPYCGAKSPSEIISFNAYAHFCPYCGTYMVR